MRMTANELYDLAQFMINYWIKLLAETLIN